MNINTGLILCAGFGKRVAPLTNFVPKPLLKVQNKVLLDNSIHFLQNCGIKKIYINTHYLADQIEDFIKKKNYKIKIQIFFEREILNTGGGIKNMLNNERENNFLIINSDTIWGNEYVDEFFQMKKTFFEKNSSNILMLVNKKRSFDKRLDGDFSLKNNLLSKKDCNEFIFTGCQILSKNVFKNVKKTKFSINEIWNDLLKKNRLQGIESQNKFLHVTDLEMYNRLNN